MPRVYFAGMVAVAVLALVMHRNPQADVSANDDVSPGVADTLRTDPRDERARVLEAQLHAIQQVLAGIQADNDELLARVRELSLATRQMAGGQLAQPAKPQVHRLPDELPELQPLPGQSTR